MFDRFLKFVSADSSIKCSNTDEFLEYVRGKTFLNGLYTIFKKEDIQKWNDIIGNYFPNYKNTFEVLSYDWLGRIYVIDNNTKMIKLFDPEEYKCYATDMDITVFHEEIVNDPDGILSINYFNNWFEENKHKVIKYGNCVGFKVPLSLGGKDELDNLEEIDMDVYWTITLDINSKGKGE